MDFFEKTIKSEYIFDGRVVRLRYDEVELPDGSRSNREIVEHYGGVAVAAITDEDEIFLVRQYRHPYGEVIYEIPAGKIEKGEDPFECGKRELKEEVGATADHYELLAVDYPSPGYCGEKIYIYYADGLHLGENELDEGEFLEVVKVPFDKAVEMVMKGEIPDSKTQIAILKLKLLRDKK